MAGVTAADDAAALAVNERARAQLAELLSKNWTLPGAHPLARPDGAKIGPYRLIVLLGPRNAVGSQLFQVFLAAANGALADEPLALGLYNSGPYPGFNWLELTRYNSRLSLAGRDIDLVEGDLDLELFRLLSDLVPAGGHLMVEYDSPSQADTALVLTRGMPAVASPVGYRLFQVGARSFRDWYIPEGGREGPRKLQAFKPWNEEIAREKTEALRVELESFLAEPPADETGAAAAERARRVLKALE
jgi:hypothetical protein